jgi:2-methylisocitrate lyase-like PEP mutase family enzyme
LPAAPQSDAARQFRALHVPGNPLILFNVWDAGSAKAVATAGAKAIGTGSWSVAAAQGYADGEAIPRALAIANIERIVAAVQLPVTIDLEGGYGRSPDAVGETVGLAAIAGAVGCNLEDRVIGGSGLYGMEEQAARLAAARAAARDIFINARMDLFLQAPADEHRDALLEAALERGRAYAAAGADGLFVPGLGDEALIERFCREAPLPVNIMVWHHTPPLRRLAELGVARISHAGAPYRLAMEFLEERARTALNLAGEASSA